jgi:DNA-binding GntR family transcriptional regulator
MPARPKEDERDESFSGMADVENADVPSATAQLNKKSLGQQVYELLERWIIEGKLAPGTRLTADSIAKMVGVSRSPVREAIFELQRAGLAERYGFHDFRVLVPTERFVLDLFDLSVILEAGQMYFACLKATPDDIAKIAAVIDEMGRVQDDKDRYAALSRELSVLFRLGYENVLLQTVTANQAKFLKWLEHAYYSGEAARPADSHAEHLVLFEKFRERDLAGLIGALHLHMYKHRARVLKTLLKNSPEAKTSVQEEDSNKTNLDIADWPQNPAPGLPTF